MASEDIRALFKAAAKAVSLQGQTLLCEESPKPGAWCSQGAWRCLETAPQQEHFFLHRLDFDFFFSTFIFAAAAEARSTGSEEEAPQSLAALLGYR